MFEFELEEVLHAKRATICVKVEPPGNRRRRPVVAQFVGNYILDVVNMVCHIPAVDSEESAGAPDLVSSDPLVEWVALEILGFSREADEIGEVAAKIVGEAAALGLVVISMSVLGSALHFGRRTTVWRRVPPLQAFSKRFQRSVVPMPSFSKDCFGGFA